MAAIHLETVKAIWPRPILSGEEHVCKLSLKRLEFGRYLRATHSQTFLSLSDIARFARSSNKGQTRDGEANSARFSDLS